MKTINDTLRSCPELASPRLSIAMAGMVVAAFSAQTATLDPKILDNLSLGQDPEILPRGQRAQVEPHIARSYSDPRLLIATWQSGRFEAGGGAIGHEYAVSRDGGVTWQRRFVPGLTQGIDAGPFNRVTDPVGAISFDNVIFQNSLAYNMNLSDPPSWLTLSKMEPEDSDFGDPLVAFVDQWPANFVDKNWIAVNAFPGSPTYRQIAIAANVYLLDANNNLRITNSHSLLITSDDGGESWDNHLHFAPTNAAGMQPVYLPNGDLVVGINLRRPGTFSEENLAVVVSEDGGATFGPPISVAPDVRINYIPGIRSSEWLHSLTTDRLRGVLYMTWQELSPAGHSLIQFSRSIDGGEEWSSPANVRDVTDGHAFNPAIAASPDGQHVTMLFYDNRGQSGLTNNVYLAESFDGGTSWEPNLLVSSEPSDFSNAPQTSDGYFYGDYHAITPALDLNLPGVAIWSDGRNGDPDIYVAQIERTQGSTFEAWRWLRFSATQLSDPFLSGEAGDPDGDGVPNLFEYLLGWEPDEPDGAPFTIKGFSSPDSIEVTYTGLPIVTDKEVFWEKSTDLKSWISIAPSTATSVPNDEVALWDYSVRFESTGESILFLRMSARDLRMVGANHRGR